MKIRVISNAKTEGVFEKDGFIVVKVSARPVKGNANKRVEELLTQFYGKKTVITKGFKSKEKEVMIQGK